MRQAVVMAIRNCTNENDFSVRTTAGRTNVTENPKPRVRGTIVVRERNRAVIEGLRNTIGKGMMAVRVRARVYEMRLKRKRLR